MKVEDFIYGKDDAPNLIYALKSLLDQELDYVLYVDDGSSDNSIAVAEDLGVDVIRARKSGDSWLGTPKLSLAANAGIDAMLDSDFFLVSGSDIVLPRGYTNHLLLLMQNDPKLVFASGIITGEHWNLHLPKGAGRLHRTAFWKQYIGKQPFCFIWESYAVYKAMSLGFRTLSVPSLEMITLRKSGSPRIMNQAYAMKQLGCFPPYALFRSFRIGGLKTLLAYLRCNYQIVDYDLASYVRLKNCRRLIPFLS